MAPGSREKGAGGSLTEQTEEDQAPAELNSAGVTSSRLVAATHLPSADIFGELSQAGEAPSLILACQVCSASYPPSCATPTPHPSAAAFT